MNTILAVLGVALLTVGSTFSEEEPSFHNLPQPVDGKWAFTVLSDNDWTTIEYSADLSAWSALASIAGVKDAHLYVDETDPGPALRFYRLRSPGTTPGQARQVWEMQGPANYFFDLTGVRVSSNPDELVLVWGGRIQVKDGMKTVTDVSISSVEGENQMANAEDDESFPAIEELFDIAAAAQATGVQNVSVRYDEEQGYPFRIVIDNRTAMGPGELLDYRVENLTPLP